MKNATCLLLLTSLYGTGCGTSAHVARAIDAGAPGLSITSVTAGGAWSTGEPGHGLRIHVWAESDGSRYEPNLKLELDGAARVCAALANSDRITKWAYIDVYFFTTYHQAVGAQRTVTGVAEVIVRRETLVMLREQRAPASAFREHWRFIAGHKDQPGTKSSLSWWTNSIGMDFVRIPSGTFTMGSGSGAAANHEKPLHTVTIRKSFNMATTEVTQAQWKAVMGSNPSRFHGDDLPVEQVSWDDANAFTRKLNAKEGTTRYRLPTEAEWEYACRAGTTGECGGNLDAVAWYAPNSGGTTHPVGAKQANTWGLYDMLGNVYEWCEDWKDAYPSGHVTDPQGPSSGSGRVVRGGSWLVHANRTRPDFRDFFTPDYGRDDVGFRVVAVAGTP